LDARFFPHGVCVIKLLLKGIVQSFELGGKTSLIRSGVKYWKPGKIKIKFNDTISREELKPFLAVEDF
jgi:hypothetical protein